MNYCRTRTSNAARIALVLVCIQLAGAATTFAEYSAGPLVLSQTFVKKEFTRLELEKSKPVSAFSTTDVTCPAKHTKGCTIRVETSFDMWDVPPDGAALESLYVSGLINDVIVLEPTSPLHSQRTFQFMVRDIDAGETVTIDLQLENLIDTAQVGDRVETIELLLN